jgi:hypothetical protein
LFLVEGITSLEIPRPVDPSLHPLMTGNYRIATPAIEEFYELVARCLRYRVMGALIYANRRPFQHSSRIRVAAWFVAASGRLSPAGADDQSSSSIREFLRECGRIRRII